MATQSSAFAGSEVATELVQDVQTLNHIPEQQLHTLMDIVVSFLVKSVADADEELTKFSENTGASHKVLKKTINGVLYFFTECVKKNMTPDNVNQELQRFGLDSSKAALLSDTWRNRLLSVGDSLVDKTFRVNRLSSMLWRFGVTAANQKADRVGTCFLQLKLVLETAQIKDGKRGKQTVLVEVSLPLFYKFLEAMTRAVQLLE